MSKTGHEAPLDPALTAALLEALTPVAPRDPALLRARALAVAETPAEALLHIVRAPQGAWVPLLPGIALKALRLDEAGGTQTSLWRLDADARIPAHDHTGEEECLVLAGSVVFAGVEYVEGDYLLARPGLHHTEFVSPRGALLLLRSELTDFLLPRLRASLAG